MPDDELLLGKADSSCLLWIRKADALHNLNQISEALQSYQQAATIECFSAKATRGQIEMAQELLCVGRDSDALKAYTNLHTYSNPLQLPEMEASINAAIQMVEEGEEGEKGHRVGLGINRRKVCPIVGWREATHNQPKHTAFFRSFLPSALREAALASASQQEYNRSYYYSC